MFAFSIEIMILTLKNAFKHSLNTLTAKDGNFRLLQHNAWPPMTEISVFRCFSQHPIGAASEQILKDVRVFSDGRFRLNVPGNTTQKRTPKNTQEHVPSVP